MSISVPGTVLEALRQRLAQAPEQSGSGFVCDLLKRELNVGGEGMAQGESLAAGSWKTMVSAYLAEDQTVRRDDCPAAKAASEDAIEGAMKSLREGRYDRHGLRSAIPWYILGLLSNSRRFGGAFWGQDVYYPDVLYSSEAVNVAFALLMNKWNRERFAGYSYKSVPPAPGAFDAAINLEFALSAKSLYLFPFVFSEFRRPFFGVIPYGRHVAIGWLIHKDNPLLEERPFKDFDGELKPLAVLPGAEGADRRNAFLTRLFAKAGAKEATIVTRDNYLNREILPLLKTNAQHGLLVDAFSKTKIVEIMPSGTSWPIKDKPEKEQVLLYDLCTDRDLATSSAAKGFRALPFLHDQEIPVGIGFSLPALPFVASVAEATTGWTVADLLRNEVKEISKKNWETLPEEMLRDGILLADDLRFNKDGKARGGRDNDFIETVLKNGQSK